ncbi:hypothetical protein ACEPAG_6915 [Sanghuangporus baumii]
MSAYLRSWLGGSSSSSNTAAQPQDGPSSAQKSEPEVSLEVSEPDERNDVDSDGASDRTETDAPPAFPALNSAQRLGAASIPSAKQSKSNGRMLPNVLTDTSLMPPPPSPGNALRVPGVPAPTSRLGSNSLNVPSASSSLMPPPSMMNGSGSGNTLGVPPTTTKPPAKKAREKVALAPGFGPLDWAALKSSGTDLRGVETLLRVTPSMLKAHNKKDDAWSAFFGKVYNITPYLPYHPGGEKELMRVAGRDGTQLFASTHAWVNVEFMLDACLVGFLVSESYGS